MDAIVAGGGIYGCSLALELRRLGLPRVILLERERDLLQRASRWNQARVHRGYHYPRSFLTALRSRVNYERFAADYRECLDDGFDMYYAIARTFSRVGARQFRSFCDRIGAEIDEAPAGIRGLFDRDLVEDVVRVRECAFHAGRLATRLRADLEAMGVDVRCETELTRVRALDHRFLQAELEGTGAGGPVRARFVFNCTYSRTNRLLLDSGIPPLPLKHELAEIAFIEVPPPLSSIGITVMCGPFFSLMPFPPRGVHSLSHVRYTPHHEWHEPDTVPYRDPASWLSSASRISRFPEMLRDARRFLPLIGECRHVGSIWEIKTTLPDREGDDSRPILFVRAGGLPNLVSVTGGKIDNVYDIKESVAQVLEEATGSVRPGS